MKIIVKRRKVSQNTIDMIKKKKIYKGKKKRDDIMDIESQGEEEEE